MVACRQRAGGLLRYYCCAAKKVVHARILLKADAGPEGPAWTDARIAEALEVDVSTVERIRQRFGEQGLEAALGRTKQDRPSRQRTLDGKAEARLIALACSESPAGRVRWTLRLLADNLVELEIVDTVSTETVRRTLKKQTQMVVVRAVASLYEAFEPERARRIIDRLEIHHTPKHGSWLNMAEVELSVLARQCLDQRIESMAQLQDEVEAWKLERSERHVEIKWQFTTADARIKLHRLYPVIQ